MTTKVQKDMLSKGGDFSFRNKIINGKMDIAQRGTSFAAIVGGAYALDRWMFGNNTTTIITEEQQADVPPSNEFKNSLRLTVTTADTSIATNDICNIQQIIEGYNIRDLIGKTFTLSFWVRSSKTGIHCIAFKNSGGDRSYVSEYTVNAANTWEYKTVTVTGGLITTGTWEWATGIGLKVIFGLAAGSLYHTTAGSWQTGSFNATANQVNCLDTVGNIFAFTGVQLEVGSVATPFEHRPIGTELALCQRYYYRTTGNGDGQYLAESGYSASTTVFRGCTVFPVPMRTTPLSLEQTGVATDYRVVGGGAAATVCSAVPTWLNANERNAHTQFTVASGLVAYAGGIGARSVGNTTAYLGWSAEL